MGKSKQSYYVVWVGVEPGVYNSWEECKLQIHNFPGAKYKKYKTKKEADAAFLSTPEEAKGKSRRGRRKVLPISENPEVVQSAVTVDAACSGNPGFMEYRAVTIKGRKQIFKRGPFIDGTNNVGEFLALVHILALLHKKGDHRRVVYTDSKTALAWLRKRRANTKLKRTNQNGEIFELLERAENWLKSHQVKNPIKKWKTKHWGEIPADFGRKG